MTGCKGPGVVLDPSLCLCVEGIWAGDLGEGRDSHLDEKPRRAEVKRCLRRGHGAGKEPNFCFVAKPLVPPEGLHA